MRTLLIALTFSLATFQSAPALDKVAILEIANKPHSRENLVPELKIFANARAYKVSMELWSKESGTEKVGPLTATEHVVDGKYVVTISPLPGGKELVMVVGYDKAKKVYRKWVIPPVDDDVVAEMIGVSLPGTRCISWAPTESIGDVITLQELHTDEGATWRQVTIRDGEIIATEQGTATKTK